jgi:hypothetical protein
MRNDDWLNSVMEFDHPVRVNEDGSVTGRGIQVFALHMDDGPGTASYVVVRKPGDITPAMIHGLAPRTLASARKLVHPVSALPGWTVPDARIIRVTDLAVMPAEAPAADDDPAAGCQDGPCGDYPTS